jgi:hypothetical protein
MPVGFLQPRLLVPAEGLAKSSFCRRRDKTPLSPARAAPPAGGDPRRSLASPSAGKKR